jgi:hypothetical protein
VSLDRVLVATVVVLLSVALAVALAAITRAAWIRWQARRLVLRSQALRESLARHAAERWVGVDRLLDPSLNLAGTRSPFSGDPARRGHRCQRDRTSQPPLAEAQKS